MREEVGKSASGCGRVSDGSAGALGVRRGLVLSGAELKSAVARVMGKIDMEQPGEGGSALGFWSWLRSFFG